MKPEPSLAGYSSFNVPNNIALQKNSIREFDLKFLVVLYSGEDTMQDLRIILTDAIFQLCDKSNISLSHG